jgi:hypothetical protein
MPLSKVGATFAYKLEGQCIQPLFCHRFPGFRHFSAKNILELQLRCRFRILASCQRQTIAVQSRLNAGAEARTVGTDKRDGST